MQKEFRKYKNLRSTLLGASEILPRRGGRFPNAKNQAITQLISVMKILLLRRSVTGIHLSRTSIPRAAVQKKFRKYKNLRSTLLGATEILPRRGGRFPNAQNQSISQPISILEILLLSISVTDILPVADIDTPSGSAKGIQKV